ncbi:MAG: hypothetical protein ABIP97_13265 [Chthoniobacterales bacterium]
MPTLASRAFTVIRWLMWSILIVLGVWIILEFTFPRVGNGLSNGPKSSAKTDVVMIASAITAYEAEYGKLPPASNAVSGDLLRNLLGENVGGNNPRGIAFLDVGQAIPGKKSGLYKGAFIDSRGSNYKIMMDTNYAGYLIDPIFGQTVKKRVLVWNPVPLIGWRKTANPNLQVMSWK